MAYLVSNEIGQKRLYKYKSDAKAYLESARYSKYPFKITKISNKIYTSSPRYMQNPTSQTDDWIPCHAIRPLPTGGYQILKEKNPGKVNFGFKDVKGVFHSLTTSAKKVASGAKKLVSRRRKNPHKQYEYIIKPIKGATWRNTYIEETKKNAELTRKRAEAENNIKYTIKKQRSTIVKFRRIMKWQ